MKHPLRPALIAAAAALALSSPVAAQDAAVPDSGYEAARRAYDLLERGDHDGAAAAARQALDADANDLDRRLLLADALLRGGRHGEALSVLEPVRAVADYRVQTRRAQAAETVGDHAQAADAYGLAAPLAAEPEARAYLNRARVLALARAGRADEGRARFREAWSAGDLAGGSPLDTAMLAISVGEDEIAQALFAEHERTTPLTGRAALDAAYSARRLGHDADAVRWFRRGLDGVEAGELELDAQRVFEIRREVETLERRWGASVSVLRGPNTTAQAVTPGAETVTQAGVEAYRRLGGYNAGRPLDLVARAFWTLDDQSGGATGSDTVQAWAGLRWRPLAQTNLVLEAGRLIAVGDLARDDTLLRAAWSAERGGDLRLDSGSWPAWRLYGDLAHMVDADQTLGVVEGRVGRAWRMGERDIVTPYLGVRGYYDSLVSGRMAVGAGPGVSWRRWFREDRHRAPASYIDLWVAYAFGLTDDDRGEGLSIGISLHY